MQGMETRECGIVLLKHLRISFQKKFHLGDLLSSLNSLLPSICVDVYVYRHEQRTFYIIKFVADISRLVRKERRRKKKKLNK